MRLSRLIATAAVAALGFTGVIAASPASAAPPSPNPVVVTSAAIAEATINYSSNVYTKTAVTVNAHPTTSYWSVYADIYVNGVPASASQLIASSTYPQGTASWPRAAGIGVVQLRNLRVSASGNNGSFWSTTKVAQAAVSNVAAVRTSLYSSGGLLIRKRGSKLTAKAHDVKYYLADGSFQSLGKVALQRLKKGKWRGFKKIKLNAAGNGKVKFTQRKKMKYRLYVPTTATLLGGSTKPGRKIRIAPLG